MSGASPIAQIADFVASLLKPVAMAGFVLSRPAIRLWRLSCLRSRADGIVPVSTQFDGPVYTSGRVHLTFGDHCRLGRGVFFETCGGHIALGSHVRINSGSILVSRVSISIGNDCLIGEYVSIRDADHGTEPGALIRTQAHSSAPIFIGDNVWIARGAVILKGVTIGNGAVVAANSVVNCNVLANTIVGGVPATVLKSRSV